MSSAGVLGMYSPGNSVMHRAPARAKLLTLLIAGLALTFTRSPLILATAVTALLLLLRAAGVSVPVVFRQVRALAPLLLAIWLAHLWLSGWRTGLLVDLRIVALVLGATAVTMTTRITELIDGIERFLSPFRRLGVDPSRVALTLSLAVRFVPLLAERSHQVREAQRARGIERSFVALLVPLLVKALQLADQTAEALQARGLD